MRRTKPFFHWKNGPTSVDHACPALDLAVEAFQWIGAVQLHPVLGWEVHVGQHIRLGAVHQNGKLGQLRPELIGNGAPLPGGIHRIILREGRGDEGRDDTPATLAGMGQSITHEVDAAALPCGGENLGIIRNFVSGACLGSPDDEPFFEHDSELRLRFRPFPC